MSNYAVILAGGVGSRFWPASREALPKQFLRLIGRDTLFETSLRRVSGIMDPAHIFIATNRSYVAQIRKQIKAFNVPVSNIILEPKPLNTLPAILLCAQLISLKDKEANLLVLPADHYIKGGGLFNDAVFKGLKLSAQDYICLMGIPPEDPNCGYGYIRAGKKIGRSGFYVESFIEKPESAKARALVRHKNTFWNSGIFCFKAGFILSQAKELVPQAYGQIMQVKKKNDASKAWSRIAPVSIDHSILQRSRRVVMVKAQFFWRDLGSWEALCSIMPKDKNNNVALSECVRLNCNNTFVCSYVPERTVAMVGVKDAVVVDTPDALLICKKDSAQDVKQLVELLKQRKKPCV